MFEKEAEEYAEDMAKYYESVHGSIPSQFEKYLRKAVEFGYNKANEWHYLSKGEYPKDEKDMLMSEQLILLTKLKGVSSLSISIGQYNFSTQEFSYPHFVGLTEVIAWKEIVLPKESE